MDLHITILSYNHPELTSRCVQSCLLHFKPHQISLIHNGSKLRFVSQLQECFPEITHLQLNNNLGYTKGANFALTEALQRAPWALFLSNDCELLSADFKPQLPNGLHAPLVYRRRTGKLDSWGAQLNRQTGQLKHIESSFTELNENEWPYVPGSSFLIDRDSFIQSGGFDTSLNTYWEDVDLSLRCQKNNIPLYQTKDFTLRHGVGKTCHKDSFYTNYLFQRNRIRVCRRWGAGSEWGFATDTFKHCLKKLRRGQWSEAWRRAKAHIDA